MDAYKIIIHDLSSDEISRFALNPENCLVISAKGKAAFCKGCFGCWLKSPGKCVFQDKLQYIGAMMAQSEEVIVISRNCYGGYSPDVKKVFDRAISSSTPFFTYRDGKIYHVKRYKNSPVFTVYMYGEISDFEKQIAGELVRTNSVNMGRRDAKCHFADDISQLRELFA